MESRSGVLPRLDDPAVHRVVARIHAAVAAGLTDRGRLTEAWRDTFALPRWYFLIRADEDGRGALYARTVRGRPHLAAFTTLHRLRRFASDVLGVAEDGGQAPMAAFAPREFVAAADEHAARGVDGIAFDHGHTGHYTSLTGLRPLWERCFGVPFDSGP